MSSEPSLLLRDALAEAFVAAAGGDATARDALNSLQRWAEGAAAEAALVRLHSPEGGAVFGAEGRLAEIFTPFEAWLRERSRRYTAALGWMIDAAADDPLEWARAAWDAGLFFEVHELLEPVWRDARGRRRAALQGLILAGAALYHVTCENARGAVELLRQAAEHLRAAPPAFPFHVESFAAELEALAASIESGSVRTGTDMTDVPRLERRRDTGAGEPTVS